MALHLLVELDTVINQLRNRLGREYLPISSRIKKRLSSANEYIRRFEEVAARYAAERGFDGIVCGHTHRPRVRNIKGICYANDGDWVEHRSALAEAEDGSLRILHWQSDTVLVESLPAPAPLAA